MVLIRDKRVARAPPDLPTIPASKHQHVRAPPTAFAARPLSSPLRISHYDAHAPADAGEVEYPQHLITVLHKMLAARRSPFGREKERPMKLSRNVPTITIVCNSSLERPCTCLDYCGYRPLKMVTRNEDFNAEPSHVDAAGI